MSADAVPEVAELARPDWRESLSLAADLALLGIVLTVACVPVVTAGGALGAASAAADHACRHRTLPPLRDLLAVFGRAIGPGLGATAALLVVSAALALDVRALAVGAVPGGTPVLVSTVAVGAALLSLACLVLVQVGRTGGRGWLRAVRVSAQLLWARPLVGLALLPVVAIPVLLASAIPVTAPLLAGMVLFALHSVVRRLTPHA